MVGFLGLSCVFALAGVLFSSLGFPQEENSPKPEPQLKQKPCLAGWRCPKLGFRPYVQFCGVSESRNPSLGDVQPDSFSLGSGLWWVCFLGLWSGRMWNPS